jgi:hypothetical protein
MWSGCASRAWPHDKKTHISAEIEWFPGGFLISFPGPGGPSNFLISWQQEFASSLLKLQA